MRSTIFSRLISSVLAAAAVIAPLGGCTGASPAGTEAPEAAETTAAVTTTAVTTEKKSPFTVVRTVTDEAISFTFDGADTISSLEMNTGGGASPVNVSLSDEQDHTGADGGKSLKFTRRSETYHRVRLLNCFSPDDVGETFTITAWVYVPDASAEIAMSVMGIAGSEFATSFARTVTQNCTRGKWTKITLVYPHANKDATALAFEQPSGAKIADTFYVDDVTVMKGGEAAVAPLSGLSLTNLVLHEGEGARPFPVLEGPSGYDTLIYYENPEASNTGSGSRTLEEIFAELKLKPEQIVKPADLLVASMSGTSYGSKSLVAVDDESVPFKQALHIEMTAIPQPNPWSSQLSLPKLKKDSFGEGDILFIVFYMKTIASDAEDGMGNVVLINEEPVAPSYSKALVETVKTAAGAGWQRVCIPFKAHEGYTSLYVRLGYAIQTIEIGGYEIWNCGQEISVKDLPSDTIMSSVNGRRDLYNPDAEWRREAWERIEQIRRGTLNVTVTSADGSPVSGADVSVRMLDHDFKFGTAVNSTVLRSGDFADKYRKAISVFFNTAVCENATKWVPLEKSTKDADDTFDICKSLGLTYFRGHTLVWDRPLSKTMDASGNWVENSSIPVALLKAEIAGDRAGIDRMIEEHIKATVTHFGVGEWDVVNEPVKNFEIREKYGNEVLKQWFDWSKQYAPDVKRYINETGIVGGVSDSLKPFMEILDWMAANDVPFDGIGVQGHFSNYCNPPAFYDQLVKLAGYGKELKITEYDLSATMHEDPVAEASFTRDIMILAFSQENVEGFLMWGFSDASHWLDNALLFDANWNLKKTGEQFVDLVYHQWWTNADGTTAANGTYATPAYFGEYEITVTKDGKTATTRFSMPRGASGDVTVKLG